MKIKPSSILLLFFAIALPAYCQNPTFDSLANELNRISIYKKTQSLEMLDNLYQMAYNSPDSSLCVARCLYEEAGLNQRQGIIDTSLKDRIKDRMAQEPLLLQEHALLQSALGLSLLTVGEFSEAFPFFLQALEKYKQLNNDRFTIGALNHLGVICYSIGLRSLAEYYFSEALTINTNESFFNFITRTNLALTMEDSNKEAIIDSMFSLIEIAENKKYEGQLPILYLNVTTRLLHTNPEKAFACCTKMQSLDFDNDKHKSLMNANFGIYYLNEEDYPQTLKYFREAQTVIENNGDFKSLAAVYGYLSNTFEEQNVLDSALFYSRKHTDLTQKLNSNTIAIETHQKLITSYLEAAQKDLIIAKQENELKNRQFVFIIMISAAVILIILLFLLFVNQQKRRKASENRELSVQLEHEQEIKKKQEELLDVKTREITSYSLLVSNKNNLLRQIRELTEHIFDNQENTVKNTAKIDEVIRDNLNIDDEWENFKMHFDKVHPHFFEKLKQRCSDLTEENLKMCAYIKIGMSNKQIAQLLNIAHTSVIVSHHRIKKKLQLPENEDIGRFVGRL